MQGKFKVAYLALLLCPVFAGFADVKLTSKYTAEGQTTETTTYARGERLRYQYAKDVTLLRDCSQQRIIEIDDKNKTFVNLPDEQKPTETVSKITLSDTGEQKQVFGRNAHHVKTTMPAEDGKGRIETDGWYIDAKEMPSCAAGGGKDAASAGYPVSYTITTYKDAPQPVSTVSMEVTELVDSPLDSALFEVPPGYTDAGKSTGGLPNKSKAAGTVRVGAVAIHNKGGQAAVNPAVYERMIAQLREAGIDVMLLPEGAPDAANGKAREAQCDYVLYTDVASVEKPAGGKVGGFIRKAPVVGKTVTGDAMEAKVDYRLVPVGGGSPELAETAIGKSGSAFNFNWKTAVAVASTVTPMLMMARMMGSATAMNPNMMNALASGKGYGASMAGMDPMMNTMALCLRAANLVGSSPPAAANPGAADSAIAAALDQETKAVLTKLKK